MVTLEQPYLSLLLIAAAVGIAIYARSRWKLRLIRPTAMTGALLLWCGSFWMIANAFEMASPDLNAASFWNRASYVGIVPVPPLWLYLALQFTGLDHHMTRTRKLLIAIIPVACLIMALTNDYHYLFFTRPSAETSGSYFNNYGYPGPFLIAVYIYGYILIALGTYLLTQKLLRSRGFRWQGTAVMLGVALSVGANIVDWSGLNSVPNIRLTPVSLAISIPLFVITLIRARRADILPIARSSLIQTMRDAVLVLDVENRIIDMNPSAERIIGHQLAAVMGKPVGEAWPEGARHLLTLSATANSSNEIRLEPGNTQQVFDARQSELRDWRGQLISSVIVLRDISERVHAEEVLRLSEEHFRALTEHASDMIMIIDKAAVVTYASPSVEPAFGFKPSAIVGQSVTGFLHPDDANLFVASLAESEKKPGIAAPINARFRRAGGEWCNLECVVNNLLNHPAVNGIVVNARDVTEREAAADALRQSEERYRLHFAHVTDVVYAYDTQLKILSATPSVERYLGVKPEDLIGRPIIDQGVLAPEYIEKAAAEALRVLSGERIEGAIYEFIRKDGTRLTGEISSSPIVHDGQVVAVINVARDITERLRIEAQLKASLQEKETLLKEVHHRVKNNMQVIASLLSLQAASITDSVVRAQFEDSQNRIRSMALVHERLYCSSDLSRIDFGVYIRDLTHHLMKGVRIQSKCVNTVVEIENIYLNIDLAVPCGLIINELVSNALKHAFPGYDGGTLTIRACVSDDGMYCLSVQDDGIGIPSTVDLADSKTLGLQLVANLARQLQGTVTFHQEHGTRVDVIFPSHSEN